MVKPIAIYLVGMCVLTALAVWWQEVNAGLRAAVLWRRRILPTLAHLAAATGPALAINAPVFAQGAAMHKSFGTSRTLDYVLYLRTATFDGLDSEKSEALADIKAVVEQAKRDDKLSLDATHRDRGAVIKAFEHVHDASFREVSAIMGRAGRDLFREHRLTVLVKTLRYAVWMILAPDPVVRFIPGGSAGHQGKRDANALIYDTATYSAGPGSWEWLLRDHAEYLPLTSGVRSATPWWTAIVERYHRHVEAAPGLAPFGGSRFADWTLVCLLGLALALTQRNRRGWYFVAMVLVSHVLTSAFLGGPQTRYAAPVKPLLGLGGAWALVNAIRLCTWCRLIFRSGVLRRRALQWKSVEFPLPQ
jgi:hypothetical protein